MKQRHLIIAGSLAVLVLLPLLALPQEAPPEKPKPAAEKPTPRLDLYGDPLPEGAVRRFGSIRFRHAGIVTSVTFSPNGKLIVTGGEDGDARLWDRQTGKEQRRFSASGRVADLDFSPDGKTLAIGNSRGVRVCDLSTGEVRSLGLSDFLHPMGTIRPANQEGNHRQWSPHGSPSSDRSGRK